MNESSYPSKICRPILADVLFRERLFKKLDTLKKQSVVWVSGPGGAGKTTLLNSYAENRDLPCLWYQLDSSDQDLATFFYYLGLAGKKASTIHKGDYPALTAEYRLGIREFSRNFFSELFQRLEPNSLLVFDNCQDVGEKAILFNAILAALSRMPQGMNIVFISRNEPVSTFSRLKANRRMSLLNWPDLRLTSEEFAEIAVKQGITYPRDQLNELHKLIDGWAAGLTLMLVPNGNGLLVKSPQKRLRSQSKHNIFEYFAEEIFAQLDVNTREFLVRSSLMPFLDEDLVAVISDNRRAFTLLNRLYRSNIYISQLSSSPPVYQYHQLFKEFLKDRCTKMLSQEEITALQRAAAYQLRAKGQVIEAAELLIEAKDWRDLVTLIDAQAQSLFLQGQYQTLAHWLQYIPGPMKKTEPWLLYWSGMCLMLQNPEAGRKFFDQALAGFEARKDITGIYLAASGLGECLGYGFNSFIRYDQWIKQLGTLYTTYPEFPSKEVEARVTISMLNALSLRQPSYSGFRSWRKRAYSLLETENEIQTELKIQLLIPLTMNRLFSGNLIEANQLIKFYRRLAKGKDVPTLALLTLKNFEGHYYWQTGNSSKCCATVDFALDLARKSGIQVLTHLLLLNGATGALTGAKLKQAETYLNQVEPALARAGAYVTLIFHLAKIWKYLLTHEAALALYHAEKARRYAEIAGNPESTAFAHLGNALALHAAGRYEEADQELTISMNLSLKAAAKQVTFACLLTQAEFSIENDNKEAACNYLKDGLTLGRENAYSNFYCWRPQAMGKLCEFALREGIETKYTQELIRRRRLIPSGPPASLQSWPWTIRIFTFGKFEIFHDDRPLQSKGKTQQKPLALFKLLISQGGVGVPQSRLADILWPDADGDIQLQTFNTTLHRLRKLLGEKDILILSSGELTLNNRLCWVDTWSFECHVNRIAKAVTESTLDPQSVHSAIRVTDLYQGPFLATEQEGWVIPLREKLYNKMVQTIERLGQYYYHHAHWEQAIEWYRKGINIDPAVELFYHQLMLCYHRQKRKAEALQTYNQCCTVLEASMGIGPSQPMQTLYEELCGKT